MGGERFEGSCPECYLFGENHDLNFLGSKPVPLPYPAPLPNEPVRALRSLVNIRKDSLRLVKCNEEVKAEVGEVVPVTRVHYNVEFTFDSDAPVDITIYYQATEEFHNANLRYVPKTPQLQSEASQFKAAAGQQFFLPSHTIDPSDWYLQELCFETDREVFPMVIQANVTDGGDYTGHSHVLMATFEKHGDGTYSAKPLKQKQVVDGVSYLLQEIYGIENKSKQHTKSEDEGSDNSGECVVCLSDVRDTLILPCRHLCLCSCCAETLRYQASNCPICRLPFRGLLQIRALQWSSKLTPHAAHSDECFDTIPPGYEAVSLLEALNGPCSASPSGPVGPGSLAERLSALGLCTSPSVGLSESPSLTSTEGLGSHSASPRASNYHPQEREVQQEGQASDRPQVEREHWETETQDDGTLLGTTTRSYVVLAVSTVPESSPTPSSTFSTSSPEAEPMSSSSAGESSMSIMSSASGDTHSMKGNVIMVEPTETENGGVQGSTLYVDVVTEDDSNRIQNHNL
uniref:E3 ubiquitin-protein ligase n=1 Tax=Eptatretus burgeri TaxID=7764 RepID=A0A8C4NF09_EPTBU